MKKVLIVDDAKNIRTLLTTCLEIEGYEVHAASDGRQALDLFEAQNFDLAFLDIKMPLISGTEVLKTIRKQGIFTPVIIITAFATVKNAVECTKLGAVAYLQKPFTADKVRAVLKEVHEFEVTRIREEDMDIIKNLVDAGSYTDAVQLLKRAVSIEPANPELFLLLGKAYEGLGDKEHAERFYEVSKTLKST